MKKMIVFAGPSGVGKSTLSRELLEKDSNFEFSISATTRPQREGDIPNKSYYFLSEEEFKDKISQDDFVEFEEVYPGRFYGTLKSEINRINDLGKKVIFDIDVLGALNIKKQFGDSALIILVKPNSLTSLEQRLRDRGTDSEDDIKTRINRFEKELSYESSFDEVIVNKTGEIDSAVHDMNVIIEKHFKKQE